MRPLPFARAGSARLSRTPARCSPRRSMSTLEHTPATRSRRVARDEPTLSVVIPCLNEEENITEVVTRALTVMEREGIHGEVVVADNRSEDSSAELAAAAGARVVHEPRRGYGSAYLAGFAAARGRYIVMADADLTYDFDDIPRFLAELEAGGELVMGDRMDNIQPGAMPWMHRYVGNPALSGILNLFFKTGIRDAHCGMRALRRDVLPRLDLRTPGMEFASRDGHPGLQGGAGHPRAPDPLPPARRRVQALHLQGRLAPPALPARPQPDAPVHDPGRRDGAARGPDRADRAAAGRHPRPHLGPAHDGRRLAADHRRHADRRPRPRRARLRDLLHGRQGPVVRPHAGAPEARARPADRRRDRLLRLRRDRRRSSASGSTAASARCPTSAPRWRARR